jgi:hypothetical protein
LDVSLGAKVAANDWLTFDGVGGGFDLNLVPWTDDGAGWKVEAKEGAGAVALCVLVFPTSAAL